MYERERERERDREILDEDDCLCVTEYNAKPNAYRKRTFQKKKTYLIINSYLMASSEARFGIPIIELQ